MADVFIDSLRIENFGPYYGEHEFQFGPLDGRGAILIGGKNGAGKTHLLRALYLAAVGEGGKADLRDLETGADSTRFRLEKSLNRKAQREGADISRLAITISQRGLPGAGEKSITLVREIRFRNSGAVFDSHALKDGGGIRIETDQLIQRLRDTFLPRHLARFFFFDAERGQSLNLAEKDIVEGISRVLGYGIYKDLEDDLRALIQKTTTQYRTNSSETELKLADISAELQRSESYLRTKGEERTAVRNELSDLDAELIDVEDELKTVGAVDPEEIQRAQIRRDEVSKGRGELEATLEAAWEAALPTALLGDFRAIFAKDLMREERRRDWETARSSVEPKIPQVKRDVFDNAPPEVGLDDAQRTFYGDRIEKALHRLFHPPPEDMAGDLHITDRNDLSAQIRSRLFTATTRIEDLAQRCEDLERMDVEARELEQKLRTLTQDKEALARGNDLREHRGQLLARSESLRRRISDLENEIAALNDKAHELKREESNLVDAMKKVKHGRSLITLAASYRDAAAEIRSRAAIELREKLAEYVGELWIEIADRKHEFIAVEFDTTWNCWLLRRDGRRISWDEINASAGQRQVRLLAFTEALRRLARVTPPLVVDTPLGRLDKEVRDAVLDQVYLASHQSIILSTNEEIDPEGSRFERVRPRLARAYTLQAYGDPSGSDYNVQVTNNYFGKTV